MTNKKVTIKFGEFQFDLNPHTLLVDGGAKALHVFSTTKERNRSFPLPKKKQLNLCSFH